MKKFLIGCMAATMIFSAAAPVMAEEKITIIVKGVEVDFSKYDNVLPRKENDRTLVPLRAVVESLEADVSWFEETGTIEITKGTKKIVLTVGERTMWVNGEESQCEVAPVVENGRTLVPIRIVSEALSLQVDWDEATSTVIIEEISESHPEDASEDLINDEGYDASSELVTEEDEYFDEFISDDEISDEGAIPEGEEPSGEESGDGE